MVMMMMILVYVCVSGSVYISVYKEVFFWEPKRRMSGS